MTNDHAQQVPELFARHQARIKGFILTDASAWVNEGTNTAACTVTAPVNHHPQSSYRAKGQ